jgi:hypothetical protein
LELALHIFQDGIMLCLFSCWNGGYNGCSAAPSHAQNLIEGCTPEIYLSNIASVRYFP